jgi:hypothetical protein
MNADIKPNLFIVGAPKAGTTALHEYLSKHPLIFMPRKEIHFFGKDLYHSPRDRTGDPATLQHEYLKLFSDTDDCIIRGDSSVNYLYSQSAAQEIHEFNESAKVIIMLRNPVEFIAALYSQNRFDGAEQMKSLGDALAAEPARILGELYPRKLRIPSILHYRKYADYAPSVGRYLDVFGRDNVKIILFDDFVRDTREQHLSVLEFLDLPKIPLGTYERLNARKQVRSAKIRELIKRPSPQVRAIVHLALPSTTLRHKIGRFVLRKANAKRVDDIMDDKLAIALTQEFSPKVKTLAELIERDLGHWLDVSNPSLDYTNEAES